jgi:anti-anti-sigma regulatory factor
VVEGILVLRIGVPLFWVNAVTGRDQVVRLVEMTPATRALVIALEGTSQFDTTSADTLVELLTTLRSRDVDVYFVQVMFLVRDLLRHSGALAVIGEDHVWHSISDAVSGLARHTGSPLPQGRSNRRPTSCRRGCTHMATDVPRARTSTGIWKSEAVLRSWAACRGWLACACVPCAYGKPWP